MYRVDVFTQERNWCVYRRYSEFLKLHQTLSDRFRMLRGSFPPKQVQTFKLYLLWKTWWKWSKFVISFKFCRKTVNFLNAKTIACSTLYHNCDSNNFISLSCFQMSGNLSPAVIDERRSALEHYLLRIVNCHNREVGCLRFQPPAIQIDEVLQISLLKLH